MTLRSALLLLLLAGACTATDSEEAAPPRRAARADHLLLVSVDGLRPDAMAGAGLPAFARLLDGAATLDARCDPDWSVTLPNHVGMLTGRFVEGAGGHGWTLNDMPPPGLALRTGQQSLFHVAADAGLRSGMFVSKEKFLLFPRSWNGVDGGAEHGPIQHYSCGEDASAVAAEVTAFWEGGDGRSLAFAHFADPDAAGHAAGWDLRAGSPYLQAVADCDRALGGILAWLDARPERRARTAIVLTADHGGGVPYKNHHGAGRALANVRVPLLVWSGDGSTRGDLYARHADTRRAPGDADPRRSDPGPPPLRNLDAAGLALEMLGLPPLPAPVMAP